MRMILHRVLNIRQAMHELADHELTICLLVIIISAQWVVEYQSPQYQQCGCCKADRIGKQECAE